MRSSTSTPRAQGGFTLIELMIVVAIIGILAAVAIPQYQNYTRKAKIGNSLTSVDSLKTAVGLCAQEAGGVVTACSDGLAGIPTFTATKEVASATVTAGVIVATLATGLGTGLDGKTITWTPNITTTGSNLKWVTTTNITDTVILDQVTKNN